MLIMLITLLKRHDDHDDQHDHTDHHHAADGTSLSTVSSGMMILPCDDVLKRGERRMIRPRRLVLARAERRAGGGNPWAVTGP